MVKPHPDPPAPQAAWSPHDLEVLSRYYGKADTFALVTALGGRFTVRAITAQARSMGLSERPVPPRRSESLADPDDAHCG